MNVLDLATKPTPDSVNLPLDSHGIDDDQRIGSLRSNELVEFRDDPFTTGLPIEFLTKFLQRSAIQGDIRLDRFQELPSLGNMEAESPF